MKITRRQLRKIINEVSSTLRQEESKILRQEALEKPQGVDLGDRTDYALDTRNSERDETASIYSDVYKEKYGVRPRHIDWDVISDDEAQAMLDRLYDEPGDDSPSSYGDYEHTPIEPEYPDMEGTIPSEETPASVRSGGFVRPLGSEEDEPDVRISKSWKAGERDPMMGRSLDRLGRVQTRQKSQR